MCQFADLLNAIGLYGYHFCKGQIHQPNGIFRAPQFQKALTDPCEVIVTPNIAALIQTIRPPQPKFLKKKVEENRKEYVFTLTTELQGLPEADPACSKLAYLLDIATRIGVCHSITITFLR